MSNGLDSPSWTPSLRAKHIDTRHMVRSKGKPKPIDYFCYRSYNNMKYVNILLIEIMEKFEHNKKFGLVSK